MRLQLEAERLDQTLTAATLEQHALRGLPRAIIQNSEACYEALGAILSTRAQLRPLLTSLLTYHTADLRSTFYALIEQLHEEAGELRGVADCLRHELP